MNRVVTEVPFPHRVDAPVWVATIWWTGTDWQRNVWTPLANQRGWQIPADLNVCDLIEIGADDRGRGRPVPHRWYATALALDNGFLYTSAPTEQIDAAWATRSEILDRYRTEALARVTPTLATYTDGLLAALDDVTPSTPTTPGPDLDID